MMRSFNMKSHFSPSSSKRKHEKSDSQRKPGIRTIGMIQAENQTANETGKSKNPPKSRHEFIDIPGPSKTDQFQKLVSKEKNNERDNFTSRQKLFHRNASKSIHKDVKTIGMAQDELENEEDIQLIRTHSVNSSMSNKHSEILKSDVRENNHTSGFNTTSQVESKYLATKKLANISKPPKIYNKNYLSKDLEQNQTRQDLSEFDLYSEKGYIDQNKLVRNNSEIYGRFNKYLNMDMKKVRRKELPAKPRDATLSLWVLYRSSIGREESILTMPIAFSEPISTLQKLSEDFEFSYLLDKAALCRDKFEQLAIVASFVVSTYSSTGQRITKPFNSVLGETYELDRKEDMGWKLISEQVSSFPPTSAHYCESNNWKMYKTFSVEVFVFRGNYLCETPSGDSILDFGSGNKYSWKKVESRINNVLNGKMRLDYVGETDIVSHKYGNICTLSFFPYDHFDKAQQRRIEGIVTDSNNEVKWLVEGKWDSYVDITPVVRLDNLIKTIGIKNKIWQISSTSYEIKKYYNFTLFTIQLNEADETVAPTDSRRRKDMRFMEEGEWHKAEMLKKKYDAIECGDENHRPLWFTLSRDYHTRKYYYHFDHEYWQAKQANDWSKCPDIFSLKTK